MKYRLVNLNFQRKDQKPQPQETLPKFDINSKQEVEADREDDELQKENLILMEKYRSNVEQVKSIQSILVEISGVVQKFNETLENQNLTTEKSNYIYEKDFISGLIIVKTVIMGVQNFLVTQYIYYPTHYFRRGSL
jgi:hypothetical protein